MAEPRDPPAEPAPTTRYVAKKRLLYDRNEDTGEPIYYEIGQEIPASQYGSTLAVRAAIQREDIGEIPPPVAGVSGFGAGDAALRERLEQVEAELAALKAVRHARPSGSR